MVAVLCWGASASQNCLGGSDAILLGPLLALTQLGNASIQDGKVQSAEGLDVLIKDCALLGIIADIALRGLCL